MPTMPRSSSGVFHAVLRPCVPVNTPPSGGPTSSPKMSVTPSLLSPTCSAMRIAWIMLGMSLTSDEVLVGEHVAVDLAWLRRGLVCDPLARVEQLLVVLLAQLVD